MLGFWKHSRTLAALAACLWMAACSSGDDGDGAAGTDPFGNSAGDGASGAAGSGAAGSGSGAAGSGAAGSGAAGAGSPNSQGSRPVQGGFIPMFPGGGTSEEAKPLANAGLCDYVEGDPVPHVGSVTRCFFGPDDMDNPAATIEQILECVEGVDALRVRLTFDPNFVDNTYGAGSVGWDGEKSGEREFKKLVGSDHAEILILDDNGDTAAQFALDYVSEDASAPSGYASLGVSGGDGEMIEGDPAIIVKSSTSIDRNLNERGYSDYTEDSPATDATFAPNPDTPEWDYRVVYEAWIDLDAFGDAEFGGAFIEFVHASPSKGDENTIEVVPGDCPPDWNPPSDDDTPSCSPDDPSCDPCLDGDPDTDCGTGSVPEGGTPAFCDRFPTDPECRVD